MSRVSGERARVNAISPERFPQVAIKTRTANAVFIPKPPHLTCGDAMSQMRMWLDYRKVQPCTFKITADGRIGFELSFANERDAQAFELFDWRPL